MPVSAYYRSPLPSSTLLPLLLSSTLFCFSRRPSATGHILELIGEAYYWSYNCFLELQESSHSRLPTPYIQLKLMHCQCDTLPMPEVDCPPPTFVLLPTTTRSNSAITTLTRHMQLSAHLTPEPISTHTTMAYMSHTLLLPLYAWTGTKSMCHQLPPVLRSLPMSSYYTSLLIPYTLQLLVL